MSWLRTCQKCGQSNRIPPAHLANTGRCGACKKDLPPAAGPYDVATTEQFDQIVAGARVPILIDFWAEWCGPCRMAAPEVEKTAKAVAGKALVLKVNTEANQALAQRFNVKGIPHFVVVKDGATVDAKSGLMRHRELEQWLEQTSRL